MTFQERLTEAIKPRGAVSELARRACVDRMAIVKIADGRTQNPGILTVEAIERALDELEAEASAPAETSENHRPDTGRAPKAAAAPAQTAAQDREAGSV